MTISSVKVWKSPLITRSEGHVKGKGVGGFLESTLFYPIKGKKNFVAGSL